MGRFFCGFVAIFLAGAAAPEAARIGDLAYDAAGWTVERLGQTGDMYRVASRERDEGDVLWVRISPGPALECTAALLAEETKDWHDRKFKTIAKPGLDIHFATAWTGCRNARPPMVQACAAYNGQIYRFNAPVAGCSGGPGFGPGAVDFLEQLRVP